MSTKVGILGVGGMYGYHRNGFRRAGAEIVAVADIDEPKARRTAEEDGIPNHYTSLAAMLEGSGKNLDAVSVILPNSLHAPMAIEALQAGKHVYVEKPAALNAVEARLMQDAATEANRILMCAMNNRARPDFCDLMERYGRGFLGKANSAQVYWRRPHGIPGFGGWFTTKAPADRKPAAGGGPGIDLLHMLDLALTVMGYPKPLYVLAGTFNTFMDDPSFKGPWGIPDVANGTIDVESSMHAMVTFEGGRVLHTIMSWAEMIEREIVSLAVQCTNGGARMERLFGVDGLDDTATDTYQVFAHDLGKHVVVTPVVTPDPTMGRVAAAANFIKAIEGAEQPLTPFVQSVRLMSIITAMYNSAAMGAPVSLVA